MHLGPDRRDGDPASCVMDRGKNQLPDSSGQDRPMLTFGEDIRPYRADRFESQRDGRFLAWSSSDGTIDAATWT